MPDPRALLSRIGGSARPAGSPAEAAARDVCAEWLNGSGFTVHERAFTYSAFPGLWGIPLTGAVLLMASVVAGGGIAAGGAARDRGLAVALLLLAIAGAGGWWLGRYGTQLLPVSRRRGVNLEATRGVPRVWLVAHLDSKSQPISLLVRSTAMVCVLYAWACVMLAWAASRLMPVPAGLLLILDGCAAAASVPLLMSWAGSRSDGALDNASGVATILGAASRVDLAISLGVVVTSAEEFGLAGARAWAEGQPVGVVINCDGVDDEGSLTVTVSGPERRLWRSFCGEGMAGTDVQIRRSLPGVLLDATAFADCGWMACTISRGTRGSLARVHTGRDTLAGLTGAGVERVAGMVASLAGAIIAWGDSPECRKGGLGTKWNDND